MKHSLYIAAIMLLVLILSQGYWLYNIYTFRNLSEEEIDLYLQTDEWRDKAGGYGIQGRGALLVSSIQGCYNNVVGLPISRLGEMLRELGMTI